MTDITTTSTTTTTPSAVATGPTEVVSPAPPTPGWKTSEFWLKCAAMMLTVLYASGALTNNTALAIAGMAAAILGALGYTVSRSMVKQAASNAGVVVVSSTETSDKPKFRSSGSLVVLLLAFGFGSQMSCAAGPVIASAGPIAIDCIAQDQGKLVELVGSLWSAFTSGGSWKDVETIAIANGKELGGCAIAAVVQHYLAPPKGRAAPSIESGRQARAALEDFRVTYAGGATFHTRDGDL